jgi:diguanylate cyclase (GGDEF)-like protein/PAS domain S-box-containing protein
MTILSIIALASIAIYSNYKLETTHARFAEQIFPLENASRHLSEVLTGFISRHSQIYSAGTSDELDLIVSSVTLEEQFETYWQSLYNTDFLTTDDRALTEQIHAGYNQLSLIDSQLYKSKTALLNTREAYLSKKKQTQIAYAQFESISDEILSLSNIPRSAVTSNSSSALSLLQMHLLRAKNGFSLFQYDDAESLMNTEFQQTIYNIKQQIGKVETELNHDINLLSQLKLLEEKLDDLITDVFGDDNSLVSLMVDINNEIERVERLHQESRKLIDLLTTDLNALSQVITQKGQAITDDSHIVISEVKWIILVISLLVVVSMVWFVYSISKRITKPLFELRTAMSALSSQEYETRLRVDSDKSEFSALATDFNKFSENNHRLIEDLATARDSLQIREQQITAIINGVPEAILTLSSDGKIQSTNPEAERVLDANQQDLVGMNLIDFVDISEGIEHLADLANRLLEGQELQGVDFNKKPFSMWLSLNPLSSLNNDLWVCVISDISARKKAEQDLIKTSSELDTILENAMVGIAFIRGESILRVNHKFEELFGYRRDQIEGKSISQIYPSYENFLQMDQQASNVLEEGENYEGEVQLVRSNDEKFWCSLSSKAINPSDLSEGSIWLYEDVTLQRENDEKLRKLASIDSLTELPNRTVFNDRLEHAVHKANRNGSRLAVFFLDLDHFKHVNDSLGHKAGDLLLIEVAERLRGCVRAIDTIARLGGDEFTIILEDIRSAQFVAKVAEKVAETVAKSYSLEGVEVNVSTSIGISLYPADGREVDTLIKNADAAMYHAKKHGRNNFQFYSADMNSQAAERLAMETSLRRALELNEFELNYQPQINLETKQLAGTEALLRWSNPQWGVVSPAKFVPILEEIGLISDVGELVLRKACDTFMALRHQLPSDFKMAVNLSGRQFHGGQLPALVRQTLSETGMPVENLELEITESILMDDTALAITTLNELSDMGVTLAIDDFGTGYSSLSYLKQFPLNVLKIDRSFVRDVNVDEDDAAIVDAILAMSKRLKLEVIAEGVETAEQLAFLEQNECQRVQGYFFSRPLSFEQFKQYLVAHPQQL